MTKIYFKIESVNLMTLRVMFYAVVLSSVIFFRPVVNHWFSTKSENEAAMFFPTLQQQDKILHKFESCFLIERQLILDESSSLIGSIHDFKVDGKKNFWIADSKEKNIKIFSENGGLIKSIGKGGAGPGEYNAPFCLAFNSSQQIFVGDPSNGRISLLNQKGDFLRSFAIVDVREIMSLDDAQVLIVASEFASGKGECLHIYTNQGTKVKSFFDIPQNAFTFNMILDHASACIDRQGNIYGVFTTEYKINKYAKKGNFLLTFNTLPDRYVKAPGKFEVPTFSKTKMVEWINSWSQVLKIVCAGDYVVVCLSIPGEQAYELDIFTLEGKLRVGNIKTDYRLLSSDREGRLYFLSEEEKGDQILRRIIIAKVANLK